MKQVIVVRNDLKMSKGKIANQVAHASIGAYRNAYNFDIEKWLEDKRQTKIILKVNSAKELDKYYYDCVYLNLNPYMVKNLTEDKWHNEQTCFGIGPYKHSDFNIFNDLKTIEEKKM